MERRSKFLVKLADPAVLKARGVSKQVFQAIYDDGAPWDLEVPQPEVVRIESAGGFRGAVLDAGCGLGANAEFLAGKGYDVLAIDFVESVVARARERYRAECANAGLRFEVGDVLRLDRLARTFDCVLDFGTFHVFSDAQRAEYERSLRTASRSGTVMHLICFSEEQTRLGGPRRVSLDEIQTVFDAAWELRAARRIDYHGTPFDTPARGWAVELVRR